MPVEGGEPRRVTSDNRYILVDDVGTGRPLDRVLVGPRAQPRAVAGAGLGRRRPTRVPMVSENASDPAFSRDGRRMVYAQFFEDTNIWRFDLERARAAEEGDLLDAVRFQPVDLARWRADRVPLEPVGQQRDLGERRGGPRGVAADACRRRADGDAALVARRRADRLRQPARRSGRHLHDAGRRRRDAAGDELAVRGRGAELVARRQVDLLRVQSQRRVAGLARASAGGGPEEQVTRLGGFAAFESPDGQYLYYAKGRSSDGLWRKRLPDGAEEPFVPELEGGLLGLLGAGAEGPLLPGLARSRKTSRRSSGGSRTRAARTQVGTVDGSAGGRRLGVRPVAGPPVSPVLASRPVGQRHPGAGALSRVRDRPGPIGANSIRKVYRILDAIRPAPWHYFCLAPFRLRRNGTSTSTAAFWTRPRAASARPRSPS